MSDKSSIAGRKKLESTRAAKPCWGRAGRAQARGLDVPAVHFEVEKQQHNSFWEALMGQQRCPHLVPGRKTFPASSSTKRSTSGTGSAADSPIHQLLLCRIGAGQHHTCVLPVLGHKRGFSLSDASCRNREPWQPMLLVGLYTGLKATCSTEETQSKALQWPSSKEALQESVCRGAEQSPVMGTDAQGRSLLWVTHTCFACGHHISKLVSTSYGSQ